MAIDQSLKTLLAAQSSITSLLAATTAIYLDTVDEGAATPYLAITKASGDALPYLSSTSGIQQAEVIVGSVSNSRVTSNAINKAVFDYIKDYSGAAGSDTINAVDVTDSGASDEVAIGQGTENYKYVTALTLSIFWTPA